MPFKKIALLPLFFTLLLTGSCSLFSDLMRKTSSSGTSPVSVLSAGWSNLSPSVLPPSRDFHAMCYDNSNRIVILFGGKTNNDSYPNFYYLYDTWAYIVSQNTWSNMNPTISPAPRHRHAMCYDSYNHRAILFGGDGGDWYSNDTWAYDYASNTWSNMNPAGPPPGRYYHSICYDSVNHKVILFGGGGGGSFGDTWAYDYASNTWSNMNPAVRPAARYLFSMCFDEDHGKVILFGGRDNSV